MKKVEFNRPKRNNIYDYLRATRRIGHTRVLINSLKTAEEPFFIVGATMQQALELQKEIGTPMAQPLSVDSHDKMRGTDLPLIMDNYAFMTIIDKYEGKFDEMKGMFENAMEEIEKSNKRLARELGVARGEYWSQVQQTTIHKRSYQREKEKVKHYKEKAKETELNNKKEFIESLTLFQRIFKRYE
jgi:hypothetical protein